MTINIVPNLCLSCDKMDFFGSNFKGDATEKESAQKSLSNK